MPLFIGEYSNCCRSLIIWCCLWLNQALYQAIWIYVTSERNLYRRLVFTLRKPSSRRSCGKLSQTAPQLLLLVPLLHEPMLADILRMAAKVMAFSLSSEGVSASLGTFSGSGSLLSPWQLSVKSVSLNTSSSIVSTWLLLEAENGRRNSHRTLKSVKAVFHQKSSRLQGRNLLNNITYC